MAATRLEVEQRSLALHRAVAEKLRQQPERLEEARQRVDGWLRDGSVGERYALAWRDALATPVPDLLALLCDPGEHASELRQVSPFAGILEPRERWEILRRCGMRC